MGLQIATIIAGTHIDAALGCAGSFRRGTIGISPVGIEGSGIVGVQIDKGKVDRRAGGMPGAIGDIAEAEQVLFGKCGVVTPLGRRLVPILRPDYHVTYRAYWP